MYNLTDLLKVIIGRESNKDDIKVTMIIDPFNQRIKGRQEIFHEFFFESSNFAYNLIEIIRKVTERITDSLIEYQRRGTLFIQEQCKSQKIFGKPIRNLR